MTENVILLRFINFIEADNLGASQFGFRTKTRTERALLNVENSVHSEKNT